MEEAIELVGLGNQGFSAKSFRPTGATVAVENWVHPDVVIKIGRWKTRCLQGSLCTYDILSVNVLRFFFYA